MELPWDELFLFLKKLNSLIWYCTSALAQNIISLICFYSYQEGCDLSHFQSFINKKSLLRRVNSIGKWPSLKKLKTPLFYRSFFCHQSQSWSDRMLLFCFYNEHVSLRTKEIYKMSILAEIILILILKWYFKLGILRPLWLWIILIWAGFLARTPWFVTCSKFHRQKESSKKKKFHQ